MINDKGIRGVYLRQQEGVEVHWNVLGKKYEYAHDLFNYDNPKTESSTSKANGDDKDKGEKVATEAERQIVLSSVGKFNPGGFCTDLILLKTHIILLMSRQQALNGFHVFGNKIALFEIKRLFKKSS